MGPLILLVTCADDGERLDRMEARIAAIEARRAAAPAEAPPAPEVTVDELRALEAAVAAREQPHITTGPAERRILPPVSAAQTERCLTEVTELFQSNVSSWYAAFENWNVDTRQLFDASPDCHADVVMRVVTGEDTISAELVVARGPRAGERFVITPTRMDPAPAVPTAQLTEANGWRPCSP